MPLCTTRFLQFLQQEHAWLHSKISGGSILLNSWSSRPSWGRGREGRVVSTRCPPRLPAPNPTAGEDGLGEATRAELRDQEPQWAAGSHPGGGKQGERTHLVVPAANAELAAEAVGTGTVVHTSAVLGQGAGVSSALRSGLVPSATSAP